MIPLALATTAVNLVVALPSSSASGSGAKDNAKDNENTVKTPKSFAKGTRRDLDKERSEGIAIWEGTSVFTRSEPSGSTADRAIIEEHPVHPEQALGPRVLPYLSCFQHSITHPPSPSQGDPALRLPLPRTAYTPPRTSTSPSPSPITTTTNSRVPPSRNPTTSRRVPNKKMSDPLKPMHPFFAKDLKGKSAVTFPPPPPSQRPRMVAHYSSTSESHTNSQGSSSTDSQPTSDQVPVSTQRTGTGPEVVELIEEVFFRSVAISSSDPADPAIPRSVSPLPSPVSLQAEVTDLPIFSHRTFTPRSPRVVYTTSASEADDLLACLRGPVLGFDLEWPTAGRHRIVDGKGKTHTIKTGMTWMPAEQRYAFGQGKTALIQVCDERMVVLIHLNGLPDGLKILPSKFIGMMQDPKIYKAGVNSKNDGLKLSRDFPDSFPTGVHGLLELTHVARRVDPIGTGPGGALISLANLAKAYLGHELPKPKDVRRSSWLGVLDSQQLEYAANDVVAGLHIFLRLQALAQDQQIQIDLDAASSAIHVQADHAHHAAPHASHASHAPHAPRAVPSSSKTVTAFSGPKPPGPAQIRALDKFRAGVDIKDIAKQGNVKESTIESYICVAVGALASDHSLSPGDSRRLIDQTKGTRTAMVYRNLIRRLRKELGEPVPGSEGEGGGESERDSPSGTGRADEPR
ncbi:hypothetical protein EHS25_006490 [Saitozyma podzolica]|uniref:3'-5' exonuclease domain-containing protein n=1 Tax=Saitozyma podzolica TaxID=1890683 RepID=A0A427YRY5_9TREE|nr:hypothetical protein EHS25_006490 [Saitozyma podzolica]